MNDDEWDFVADGEPGLGVPTEDPSAALAAWWRGEAEHEIHRTVPKAIEYGSGDLIDIGRQLAACISSFPASASEADMAELGVAFYAYGKMARIMSAIQEGRKPSDDSWFDLGVYARMAQRIRQAGSWPGLS